MTGSPDTDHLCDPRIRLIFALNFYVSDVRLNLTEMS